MSIEDKMAVAIATEIGKQVPVKQVYDDAASPATKQIGYTLEDIAKAARLFTLPVQWLAVQQDRFRTFIERSASQVPEDRRRYPSPQILGPILEATKYDICDTPVTEMFEALLARAMDRDRVFEASPAFVDIVRSLSPDEARLMKYLHRDVIVSEWQPSPNYEVIDGIVHTREAKLIVPKDLLEYDPGFELYVDHLASKNLVVLHTEQKDPSVLTSEWRNSLGLMRMGQHLMEACSPRLDP